MHIGSIIKQKFETSGLSVTAFAKKLHMSRNNVYNLFERDSVSTDLLIKAGEVLHYNFFTHFTEEVTVEVVKKDKPKISILIEVKDEAMLKRFQEKGINAKISTR